MAKQFSIFLSLSLLPNSLSTVRFDPTFDPNTANRHLRLSDSDRKVTLRGERQNHADHPDRFLFWRQILGREALAGSPYYWEVEWTGQKVAYS